MWIIIFALPDLNLRESIGNENIAIVPHDDSRVIEIASKSSYTKALVENFEDQFGRKNYPSLLIISWQKEYIRRSFDERNLSEALLKAKNPNSRR